MNKKDKITKGIQPNKQYSEELYKTTLKSIGDAVIAIDNEEKISFMNPVAESLTGWTVEEAISQPLLEVFNIVNEETREFVENPFDVVMRTGVTVGLANHTVLIAKDGKEIPIADSGAPIKDREGNIIGVVLVFRDVTDERKAQQLVKEAQEYADSIIRTVRDPLIILDEDLRVISASHSFYQNFEVTSEETIGQLLYDLGNKQWDIPKLRELLKEILPKNTVFNDYEIEHNFKDLGQRTMFLNARRLYREANQTQMILLAIEDVTERMKIEKELQLHRDNLENIVEERTKELQVVQERLIRKEKLAIVGQLASGISHELRNPLGVINNSAYYLQMKLEDADEKIKKHLDILQKEITRSNTIITDLLTFAKVRSLELTDINVNTALTEVLVYSNIPENISVEKYFETDIPLVQLDAEQIHGAFLNLITNAVQAIEDSGKIVIKTAIVEDSIEIRITDTGVGIEEENLEIIFEPLYTTKAKGIGLGLSIVKETISEHMGSIKVESKVGKGTTFTIRFPLKASLEES
ncbi:MAG: ATP-binding protein [Candidatus Heimdallarchaeaceae archaeon]